MNKTLDKSQKRFPDNFKTIILCSMVGGLFGLFVMIIFYTSRGDGFNTAAWLYIAGIPVFCALTSALAATGSFYVDILLCKLGMVNWIMRLIIDSIFTLFLALGMSLGLTAVVDFKNLGQQLPFIITIFFLGCAFGVFFAIINYRFEKIRQKVSALEIENRYLAELAEKDQQLKETIKDLAIGEERNHLARELHDSISQGIHGIIFSIHSLRKQTGAKDPKTVEIINHLQKTAEATLDELRAMIVELKPSLLNERGLTEAVTNHCELFARRLQIDVKMQLQPITGLTPGQEMALYRIVQEALANIQQHAGADLVDISIVNDQEQVRLTVHDNGKGFDYEKIKRGNGLNNMKSRCRENAGTLNISAKPGAGTTVEAIFPINVGYEHQE